MLGGRYPEGGLLWKVSSDSLDSGTAPPVQSTRSASRTVSPLEVPCLSFTTRRVMALPGTASAASTDLTRVPDGGDG